jgi:hypothetical protein
MSLPWKQAAKNLQAAHRETRNHLVDLKECWEESCRHVHEACVTLGVDPIAVPADTWTLREAAMRTVAALTASQAQSEQLADALEKVRDDVFVSRWRNDIIDGALAAYRDGKGNAK